MSAPLLCVRDLRVSFRTAEGPLRAVDDVSYTVERGELLAIVGESGAGKSVSVMSLLGLLGDRNADISGSARLEGRELLDAGEQELRRLRGAQIALIPQNPLGSLNPVRRVGAQIVEQIRAHLAVSRSEARERAAALCSRVGLPRPLQQLRRFPHELSGGMRQRVMIAMALSCEPVLLIADEPTTALDVSVQAQILAELRLLAAPERSAVILVTHDLGAVVEVADRVAVMYAGRIVEEGSLEQIFYDPQHPYTWGLLGSIARIDRPRPARLSGIAGQPPRPSDPPAGCHFRPRCPHEFAPCHETPPLLARRPEAAGHRDRCWLSVADKRLRRQPGGGGEIGLDAGSKRA